MRRPYEPGDERVFAVDLPYPRTRKVLVGTLLSAVTACMSSPHQAAPPQRAQPAAAAPDEVADASFDWHGLVTVPFGTVLKDIPFTLHEVLLFRDGAHGPREVEDSECYAAGGPPPRLLGRETEEYLLCFDHDRLKRIQASVVLGAEQAAQTFSGACARWLKNSVPPAADAAKCEGREADIGWSARLVLERDPPQAALSIAVFDAAVP